MKLLRFTIIVFALAAGCSTAKREDPRELRDRARLVLEAHCGSCHIGTLTTALPKALAVYNLSDEEWSAKMTKDQLQAMVWRIEDGAPFDGADVRNQGQAPPDKPSAADREVIKRYVLAEMARRSGP
jgi:hypothetical protein